MTNESLSSRFINILSTVIMMGCSINLKLDALQACQKPVNLAKPTTCNAVNLHSCSGNYDGQSQP